MDLAIANSYIHKAEAALTHASTYHWLARYKNNDADDLLKSKEYFSDALTFLNKADTSHYTKMRNSCGGGDNYYLPDSLPHPTE